MTEQEEYIESLKDVINDLTLVVSMYISKYPFDEHHHAKQKRLVDYACRLIGKPRTLKEVAEMLGIDWKPEYEDR